MSEEPLKLSIVGPGEIAEVMAGAALDCGAATIHKVLGRRPERARVFAERFGGRVVTDEVRELALDSTDPTRAAYVATPHSEHFGSTLLCLFHGIPVLCEKPLTEYGESTQLLVTTAREQGTPLTEGWMYRHHPQVHRLYEMVVDGAIGEVERIESGFTFDLPFDPAHRLFSLVLGGGGINDVGGYPLSFALGLVRAMEGGNAEVLRSAAIESAQADYTPYTLDGQETDESRLNELSIEERQTLTADGRIGIPVDQDSDAILRVGRITAHVRAATRNDMGCWARVHGTEGEIWLEDPFLPEGERRGKLGVIHLDRDDRRERIEVPSEHDCFELEIMAFRDQVARGDVSPAWPLVDLDETVVLAGLIESWVTKAREAGLESANSDA